MWSGRPSATLVSGVLVVALVFSCGDPAVDEGSSANPADAVLTDDGAPTTRMAGPAYSPGELAGTQWSLTSLRGRDLLKGTEITMDFDEEALRGTTGCNFYGSNDVRAEDGIIDVGADEMTTIGCSKRLRRQEKAYLQALDASRTYRLDGNELELRTGSDRTILIFEKKERT